MQNQQACPKKIKKVDHVRILKKEIGIIVFMCAWKQRKAQNIFHSSHKKAQISNL